jgi:hypothetical protein
VTDDLWTIASEEHDGFARQAVLARADADMEQVMPFLLAARSEEEFGHRMAAAETSLAVLAARAGITFEEAVATAERRYALYREALTEGTDPVTSLEPLLNGGGYGQGPERPDSHTEGPDFSGGYSEVPAGTLGGPDPQVTQVRPESPGPVTQSAGSLRRQADDSPQSMMTSPYVPPDMGTGNGSVDVGVPNPSSGGYTPSVPAGMPGGSTAPVGDQQQVTSSLDPVRSRVLRATAMIAQANPGLPRPECERLGRRVVSEYLKEADLTDSVMGNGPMTDSSPGGGSSSGGGGGLASHVLEGAGLRSFIPGPGGASAGGAAGGAGAAGDLADVAELAAL